VGLRHAGRLPGSVTPVLPDRDEQGMLGAVGSRPDAALEGLLVGAPEVTQALGSVARDADVAVARGDDVLASLGLDGGEIELLAEHLGQLVEGHVDLQEVLPRLVAGPLLPPFALAGAQDGADVALALSDAAGLLLPEDELRDVDLGEGDGDQL